VAYREFERNTRPRLTTLIEGESLPNDGTSIVLLTLILACISGAATSPNSLGIEFVTTHRKAKVTGLRVSKTNSTNLAALRSSSRA
jgi:hypothetical protein